MNRFSSSVTLGETVCFIRVGGMVPSAVGNKVGVERVDTALTSAQYDAKAQGSVQCHNRGSNKQLTKYL